MQNPCKVCIVYPMCQKVCVSLRMYAGHKTTDMTIKEIERICNHVLRFGTQILDTFEIIKKEDGMLIKKPRNKGNIYE